LFLKIDTKRIDINIHPTKTEVKFDDEQSLYAILRSAIKHSLGIFQIVPTLDFLHNQAIELPYNYKDKTPSPPPIEVDSSFNPFKNAKSKSPLNILQQEGLYTVKKPNILTI